MSLLKSVTTFGSWTLVSRITGFFRDMVLANFLGAGLVSDAFFVAFKLPNLFRSLFAEGAFTSAFVPMLSQKLEKQDKETAMEFAGRAICVLTFFVAILVIVMQIFMPVVVKVMAPGFASDIDKVELAVTLSRITFPFLLFISIVSFQSGILNSLGRFMAPASAPVILNLIMISSVFVFVPFFPQGPAYGIAFSVSVAGLLEIIYLHFFLKKENASINLSFKVFDSLKDAEIKTLFKRIGPGVLGSGIYQINVLIGTILASLVGAGAISWLYYASRLQQLPLGVVGAAISVAILPVLSAHLKGNRKKEAKEIQDKAIMYGAFLSIPSMIALMVLARPIINILFEHGQFGVLDTDNTSGALIALALGLPSYVFTKALAPNFFARGDTKTPVKYSVVLLIANLLLTIVLMGPMGHVGIALASSIASFVSLYQYLRGLKKRGFWSMSKALKKTILKVSIASIFMGAVLMAVQMVLGDWLAYSLNIRLIILMFLCIVGLISFITFAKVLKILDVVAFIKGLKNAK
ncbi:MAG: murein biosynthesis integral membrane protein MurJ [Alphaproteobacteria bacterium]